MKEWIVYIVQCSDGTYYCGCTNDLDRRILAHNAGHGAKYTRVRRPVRLMTSKSDLTKSEAHQLEYQVKKQPRQKKIEFLKSS